MAKTLHRVPFEHTETLLVKSLSFWERPQVCHQWSSTYHYKHLLFSRHADRKPSVGCPATRDLLLLAGSPAGTARPQLVLLSVRAHHGGGVAYPGAGAARGLGALRALAGDPQLALGGAGVGERRLEVRDGLRGGGHAGHGADGEGQRGRDGDGGAVLLQRVRVVLCGGKKGRGEVSRGAEAE